MVIGDRDGLPIRVQPVGIPCRSCASGRLVSLVVAGWVLLLVWGCASKGPAPVDGWNWKGPVPGGYYLVRSGDTLGEIAQSRRIRSEDLIRWNRLKPPYVIYAGKLLRIAPSDAVLGSPGRTSADTGGDAGPAPSVLGSKEGAPGSRAAASGLPWVWPVDGAIRQGFNAGNRSRQGLRIACRAGEQVRAAAPGRVVYAGSGLKGYGNLIIVKHNEKYLSAYGFNRRLLAAEGAELKRGQALAECGRGADGVHLLHFEIRQDGVAVDPVAYLPSRP